MSSRFVVIGSNSFSGAHFVAYLLDRGIDVVGLSRSDEAKAVYLPYRWNDAPRNFRFIRADLNIDLPAIVEAIREIQPDYVVNFAAQAMVAQSWDQPVDWFQTNTIAHVALHDALRSLSFIRRYVHVGTPEVYGNCSGLVREDHPLAPSTPYAVSRAACDMSLRTFVANYRFPVVTTRAANVYGPGQRLYRIIPRTIMAIRLNQKLPLHGGGASVRSFIHIHDVADGTYRAALDGQPGECFHFATAGSISIRDLVAKVCQHMSVPFEDVIDIVGDRAGKDHAYLLDTERARTHLGWQDTVALGDGIQQTIDWVNRHFDELKHEPLEYIHKR